MGPNFGVKIPKVKSSLLCMTFIPVITHLLLIILALLGIQDKIAVNLPQVSVFPSYYLGQLKLLRDYFRTLGGVSWLLLFSPLPVVPSAWMGEGLTGYVLSLGSIRNISFSNYPSLHRLYIGWLLVSKVFEITLRGSLGDSPVFQGPFKEDFVVPWVLADLGGPKY